MHTLISLCSIFLRNFQRVNDGAVEYLDGAWHVFRHSDNPFTIQEYARLFFALYAFKFERFSGIIFLRAEVLEAKTGATPKRVRKQNPRILFRLTFSDVPNAFVSWGDIAFVCRTTISLSDAPIGRRNFLGTHVI